MPYPQTRMARAPGTKNRRTLPRDQIGGRSSRLLFESPVGRSCRSGPTQRGEAMTATPSRARDKPPAAATARPRTTSQTPSRPARSTSASRPACPTRTCACASTRPRRSACRWWSGARSARCWRSTNAKFGRASDFTSLARLIEDWAGGRSGGEWPGRGQRPRKIRGTPSCGRPSGRVFDVAPDGISVTLHAGGICSLVAQLASEGAADGVVLEPAE